MTREAVEPGVGQHKPGDNHDFRLTCSVCGEAGTIRISIDPPRTAVVTMELDLSEEQADVLRDHLASRRQSASEFFGDVLMEYGLGRAIGKEWPLPMTAATPVSDDTEGAG